MLMLWASCRRRLLLRLIAAVVAVELCLVGGGVPAGGAPEQQVCPNKVDLGSLHPPPYAASLAGEIGQLRPSDGDSVPGRLRSGAFTAGSTTFAALLRSFRRLPLRSISVRLDLIGFGCRRAIPFDNIKPTTSPSHSGKDATSSPSTTQGETTHLIHADISASNQTATSCNHGLLHWCLVSATVMRLCRSGQCGTLRQSFSEMELSNKEEMVVSGFLSLSVLAFHARVLKDDDCHGCCSRSNLNSVAMPPYESPSRGASYVYHLRPGEMHTHQTSRTIHLQAGIKALDQPLLSLRPFWRFFGG